MNDATQILIAAGQAFTAKKSDRAIQILEDGLKDFPGSRELSGLMGYMLQVTGETRRAVACYDRSLAIDPSFELARAQRLFCLNYLPEHDDAAALRENREAAAFLAKDLVNHPPPAQALPLQLGHGRIRLGYHSTEFDRRLIQDVFNEILPRHDRDRFDIFVYADSPGDWSATALARAAHAWRPVHGMDLAALAQTIRADGIDVLICLSSWLLPYRRLFTQRIAPIQISYHHMIGTMGLDTIDYRITDAELDPPDRAAYSTETLVRLAGGGQVWPKPTQLPTISPLPFDRRGHITFGSFNNVAKLGDDLLRSWARILHRVPSSRLIIKAAHIDLDSARRRVLDTFAASGISPERLELIAFFADEVQNVAIKSDVDLALDSFPFGGGLTTTETLWMGTPVICRFGTSYIQRVGASILAQARLRELITYSEQEYVNLAVALAGDPSRLRSYRATMRSHLGAAGFSDFDRHVRELEAALIGICAGEYRPGENAAGATV